MLSAFVSLSGQPGSPTVLLYRCEWKDTSSLADFSFEGVEPVLSSDGLRIVEPGGLIRLNRYYSLAERTVRYHVRLDSGCRAVFRSDQGDFKAYVDMVSKSVSMATDPVVETVAGFFDLPVTNTSSRSNETIRPSGCGLRIFIPANRPVSRLRWTAPAVAEPGRFSL